MSKNLSGNLLYEILRNYDANKLSDDNYKYLNSNEYLIGRHLEKALEDKDVNFKYYFTCGITGELAPDNPVIIVHEIIYDSDGKEISRDKSESQIYGRTSIEEWKESNGTDPINRKPIQKLEPVQSGRSEKLSECFEEYRNNLSDKEKEEVNKAIDGILNEIMLFEAVKGNDIDRVRELVEGKYADVNAKDNKGKTPLYYATEKGYIEVVKLLVRAKAIIYYYVINIAKEKGFAEIVNILCDQEEKNNKLYWAAEKGNLSGVEEAIKSGADINSKNMLNLTSLHIASIESHSEVVKFLLDHGAEINVIDQFGCTPLLYTAYYGNSELAKLFLEHGAYLNIADRDGDTSLHAATSKGHSKVVELLLERGADVNAVNNHGNTAMHSAAQRGFLKIVEILLQSGSDLNLTDNDEDTTLHCAAYGGNLDTVKLLIKKGADVNAKNGDGKTPLGVAKDKGYTEIVNILRNQPDSKLRTTNVEAGQHSISNL